MVKTRFKRKMGQKKKYLTTDQKASKALRLATDLAKQNEVKYNQNYQIGAAVHSTAWMINLADNINQGTADKNERVGDAINPFLLRFNALIRVTSNVIPYSDLVRVILLVDYSNTLVITDILEFGQSTAIFPLSNYKHDTRKNFRVLYDKSYPVNNTGDHSDIHIKTNIKIRNSMVQYASASANETKNAIKLLVVGQNTLLGTLTALDYFVNIYYNDS